MLGETRRRSVVPLILRTYTLPGPRRSPEADTTPLFGAMEVLGGPREDGVFLRLRWFLKCQQRKEVEEFLRAELVFNPFRHERFLVLLEGFDFLFEDRLLFAPLDFKNS